MVELRKADRQRDRLPAALADWVVLFEHWQKEDLMATVTHGPVLDARDRLERLSADAETRRLAFVRERALLDEASLLKDAREEGREEGLKAGLDQGRQEGIDQGRRDALRATAASLIRQTALNDAAIAAATGCDPAEIAELRKTQG